MSNEEKQEKRREFKTKIKDELEALKALYQDIKGKVGEGNA